MWLQKWLVPMLAIAFVAIAGGWLFGEDAAVLDVVPAPSDTMAMPIPAPFSGDTQIQGQVTPQHIVMQAPGTWQDPPDAGTVPAHTSMQPWFPPYRAAAERYRNGWRSMYSGQRDPYRRRQASWMDSICPLPKRRPVWRDQRSYILQMEQLDRQGYWDAFVGRPPFEYTGSWGR